MGVSAISQIGSVYYQNEHEMQVYSDAVTANSHAIKRGVSLTQDDIIRRFVITQLICHFELDKAKVAKKYDIDFDEYFADALKELEAFAEDGLIKLDTGSIEVTPAGRLLIRRICMAFDAYIPKEQSTQRFSRII
jgi:oxygen-independent coproporphyrinogen-3 oxidase